MADLLEMILLCDSPDKIYSGNVFSRGRRSDTAQKKVGPWGSARPDSLDRGERLSGALESAQAVSRARARKGDVSRPE
jgi:hypothetical protein